MEGSPYQNKIQNKKFDENWKYKISRFLKKNQNLGIDKKDKYHQKAKNKLIIKNKDIKRFVLFIF